MISEFRGQHRWLSNFHPCVIHYHGLTFQSVEAAYQAEKTLDLEIRKLFTTYDARTAKREGKKLKIRPDWNKIKERVMMELLELKFDHPDLRKLLIETGDEEIVEGNTWGDTFWGVCDGVGENKLGKQLMRLRRFIAIVDNIDEGDILNA
jgi:ribA/ribD-fused uncharacterized protein